MRCRRPPAGRWRWLAGWPAGWLAGWLGAVAAEQVDIQALLGHESIATTRIYTHVEQERMEKVVGR